LIIHILIVLFRDRQIPISQRTGKVATITLWNLGMYFADNMIAIQLLISLYNKH